MNVMPSLHPFDLLIGALIGGGLRLIMYVRSKNAKKYRHGEEYGSARWGTPADIEPYMNPDFSNNVILTYILIKISWPHSRGQWFLSKLDLFK